MNLQISGTCLLLGMIATASAAEPQDADAPAAPAEIKDIKAYCLDFNWGGRRAFAKPGTWAGADPKQHVAWYKAIGANVIQTFCVSCNGYAWYKNGVVPEQPGLKHDFLPERVRLGHQEGMLVMGCFCTGVNTRWGQDHPDLSYGTPSAYHIPYTDEYLIYLLACPVSELQGDDRNIAVLARAYHGASINSVRNDKGEFVEPVK